MNLMLRRLFMLLIVYPVVFVWLGIRIWQRQRLPKGGPAIIVANHNSHLDTLTLLSLFPLALADQIRPVAAADYFLKNRFMAWFSTRVIGIISVVRAGDPRTEDPLQGCTAALKENKILILFPEGTRGEPEQMSELKSGLWYLCRQFPEVPVIPVFMSGLGRAMGKGQWLPVPFFVDIYIDEPIFFEPDKAAFKTMLASRFHSLQQQAAHKDTAS